LGKFLLDIAKLIFAILVLGSLARPGAASVVMLSGATGATVVCVAAALYLRREGGENGV